MNIVGKYNIAHVYTNVIEDSAIEQLKDICNQKFVEGSHIAIMPDCHSGKSCVIGTTMTITDKVVPNIVGVDIACSVQVTKIKEHNIDFKKLDEICHIIPSGLNVWDSRQEKFDLTRLKCYRELKNTKRIEQALGTLGGGNHFSEIDIDENGDYYLVIHSGSRNLGKQVAEYYQQLAIDLHKGKDEYLKEKERIIKEYKEQGRKSEIQNALKELDWKKKESDVPDDFAYLYGQYLEDYLHDSDICYEYAMASRRIMKEKIMEYMGWTEDETFTTVHNYIDTKNMILRKGSVSAQKGEKLIIPINMRDGSIIAYGKGNPDWNYSAPHGAGRVMSRTKAKENISLRKFKKSMKGIYTTSVNKSTIDESPFAYKSLEDIIDFVKETVAIDKIIKPVYNFKASETEFSWKKNKKKSNFAIRLVKKIFRR